MEKMPPPSIATNNVGVKSPRNSNLELYRIICMIMIVAHHFVLNSGIGIKIFSDPLNANSLFLILFGAWGKTGINCFLMITGYYMCTSKITIRKLVKLLGQIYLYKILFFSVFLFYGYETASVTRLVKLLMPVWGFGGNFVDCFIVYWLSIPFLTILVKNMNKRQHELLLLLALSSYTILGTIPTFQIHYNYITWFCITFFIASYIRFYPLSVFDSNKFCGWLTIISVLLSLVSTAFMHIHFSSLGDIAVSHYFVSNCNKFCAVAVAVSSFLYFKNLKIRYNRIINTIAAGTFGVLLIHANSDAMRTWLWVDILDVMNHFSLSLPTLIIYSIGIVLIIFTLCNLIDQIRISTIEKWFLCWFDTKVAPKTDDWIQKIIK